MSTNHCDVILDTLTLLVILKLKHGRFGEGLHSSHEQSGQWPIAISPIFHHIPLAVAQSL